MFVPLARFIALIVATVTRALKTIVSDLLLSHKDPLNSEDNLDSQTILYHMSRQSFVLLIIWSMITEYDVFLDAMWIYNQPLVVSLCVPCFCCLCLLPLSA